MEWWILFLIIFGGLLVVMLLGLPVAFAFMAVSVVGAFLLWGGESGLRQLGLSIFDSLTSFVLLPLLLFILLGEALFQSGVALRMIDILEKWLGRLPGRLSVLAVVAGTLLASLTSVSSASCAVLGSTLVPEMERRGYKKSMSLGPILGSGGLAIMIPPSGLAVLLGALGQFSIGKMLIAIILPGFLMAFLYGSYIILRCWIQPSLAPAYDVSPTPIVERLKNTVKYVLPAGIVIFLVTGVIFLGIATPSEAAATGVIGAFFLAACYKRLTWDVVKKSFISTIRIAGMMLIIISTAVAFSQVLAYSGATRGMMELVLGLHVAPILVIILMQIILLSLGMFLNITPIIMITLPIFIPIVNALGFDPVWFGVIFLLNLEMASTTPPVGMTLYVMKGVAPPDTTMGDIYRAALPFLYCDVVAMALIIAFPQIALWLPSMMRG